MLFADGEADIDQVVGDHSETNPALHPIITSIAATVQTDASLTPGAPSLAVAEPSLLLLALPSDALGRVIGNADTFHALGYRCGFVFGGVEAGIGGD